MVVRDTTLAAAFIRQLIFIYLQQKLAAQKPVFDKFAAANCQVIVSPSNEMWQQDQPIATEASHVAENGSVKVHRAAAHSRHCQSHWRLEELRKE